MIGLRHGRAPIQANQPLPPRSFAATSTDAQIVKTVMKVGNATSAVKTECRYLNPAPTCGSSNRWWMPIGMATMRKSAKAMRPIGSLNRRPPIARGTML